MGDAAYVYLVDGTREVARTVSLDPREIQGEINVDLDRDGRLVGIEILNASRFLPASLLKAE